MSKLIRSITVLLLLVVPTGLTAGAVAPNTDDPQALLNHMVDEEVVATGITNPRVIAAMRATPRHEFVPADQRRNAFYDMALPIGEGQSISPPFVVAFMTEQIDPQPGDKVLEIGTGSGYQAAVLSPLVKDVYTIEIQKPLGRRAGATLRKLKYKNVHTRVGDGFKGWPEAAPFDKIIVTCSPEDVPPALVAQLREGGRMIVPVGERFQQTLYLFEKVDGKLKRHMLQPTMFVPMTGEAEELRKVMPNGARPELMNGSFEKLIPETGWPEAWYYFRHAVVQEDPTAPDGQRVLKFTNDVPGREARALQAMAIDGRAVLRLSVTFWMRARDAKPGTNPDQSPRMLIAFFDEDRAPVGKPVSLGGWTGTFNWRKLNEVIAVPQKARMAIVWIGLLGATGEASFDGVEFKPLSPNGPVGPFSGPPID